MIRILHLSDIHLGAPEMAEIYRSQVETDLTIEMEIHRLDFLVVSGDIADQSTLDEYIAAEKLFSGIMTRFQIPPENFIMVPGNHDLNREISRKKGYEFIYSEDCKEKSEEGKYIPAGDQGILLRVPEKYKERFRHFRDFHQRLTQKPYPIEYSRQGVLKKFDSRKILFLGLNSAWEIDHHYTARSGIHPNVIAHALDQVSQTGCGNWLKIAICHHPVTGHPKRPLLICSP
jgi:DNA repair exonuclease SbcCD nuclease subunit